MAAHWRTAKDRRGRPIRRMLDFSGSSRLHQIPTVTVLDWADMGKAARYPLVGRLFPLFEEGGNPDPIMPHLIANTSDRQAVFDAMLARLRDILGQSR
jgi:hypothetical protein